MSQNLPNRSLRDFVFYMTQTISYLRAWTIKTSSLPNNSMRPLSRFFSGILTVFFLTVSTFLKIPANYWSASLGFHLLGEIPAGAITSLGSLHQVWKNARMLSSRIWPNRVFKCKPKHALSRERYIMALSKASCPHLPLGWNIFDMNLTVGGLLGYSSVNSICNLNVPIKAKQKLIQSTLFLLA